jgi:hypothetical protein
VLITLQALLVILFLMQMASLKLWRSTLVGVMGVLLVLQLSFATGVAYVRADSAVEPAIAEATSPDLESLTRTVRALAIQQGVRRDALSIVFVGDDAELSALMRWRLREYPRFEVRAAWPDDPRALVITPEALGAAAPATASDWEGMSFVAYTAYRAPIPSCQQLLPPECSDALRWYLYRTSPYASELNKGLLWRDVTSAGP